MKLNLFVVVLFLGALAAPGAMAGPLPVPDDPNEGVPLPVPYGPQDAESVDELDKILKQLFPEDAPFRAPCLKSEQRPYDPDEYPGQPVTVDRGSGHVSVHVWMEGTRTTVKIEASCVSD